jgi:hypothetical protein
VDVAPEVDTDTGVEVDAGVDVAPDVDTETGVDLAPDVDTETGVDVGQEADVTPEVDTETGVDVAPEVDVETGVDVAPEVDTDTGVDVGTEVDVAPGVDTETDIGVTPDVDTETDFTTGDLDFISDIMAGRVDTDQPYPQYDLNADGFIDQADYDLLAEMLGVETDINVDVPDVTAPDVELPTVPGVDESEEVSDVPSARFTPVQLKKMRDALTAQPTASSAASRPTQSAPTIETLFGGMDYYTLGSDPFANTTLAGVLTGSQLASKRNKMAAGGYVESDFQELLRMLQD